jgi:hypothetical protein
MNDLDRDLRELFHDKAGSIDAAPAAPADVLRRGRRRQVRTVFASSLAAVAVLAIAVAVAARLTGGPNQIPVTNPPYGERIATIHGIAVTAPQGWTLIDDWPVASLLPTTSQTCSFSATGSPIGPSPAAGSTSREPLVQPSSSCTTEIMPLPAGIPVLQLANFELPLDGTVCQVGELRSIDLPADGVAAYVAAFPQGMTTKGFLAACPGGATVTTFADRGSTTTYAAVSLIGPDASPGDVATVERFMNSLGGLRVPTDQPPTTSPGYVVAAGVDGGTTWRIEAGFPLRGSGSGIGATLVVTDAEGHETVSSPVPPAEPNADPTERTERLADGSGWLAWGTSSPRVSAIASVAPDGNRTPATLLPWPDGMRSLVGIDEAAQLDGSIWYAIVPTPGRLETNLSGATATPNGTPSVLQTRQTETGDIVTYGSNLGHEWELRHENGQIVLYMDGSSTPSGSVDMLNGRWGVIDVGGGSFVIGSFDHSVERLWVTVQGSDASIEGGYADAQDRTGAPSRVWLIALPGSGWGTLENGVATRGWWISWPSVVNLHRGAVLRAGGDGTDVSWSLVYQDDHCVQLQVDTSSIAGMGDCLLPWFDLQRHGGLPLVGGVYGQGLAVVAVVLPADATIGSFRTDGDGPSPDCTTIRMESNFAGTQFCVFALTVGSSAALSLDANGDPLGGPLTIVARAGSIELTQGA